VLFVAAGVFYYFHEDEIKRFLTTLANFLSGCDLLFDSASPLGVRVANKNVIRGGGMHETAMLKWGIKKARSMEGWDNRIHVVKEFPLFSGIKKGFPLKMKYGLWMSDFLRIMSMVHLRIVFPKCWRTRRQAGGPSLSDGQKRWGLVSPTVSRPSPRSALDLLSSGRPNVKYISTVRDDPRHSISRPIHPVETRVPIS
jgi:hypothetical protein